MQRAWHSAIGLPRSSRSAEWMLGFVTPPDVSSSFMVPPNPSAKNDDRAEASWPRQYVTDHPGSVHGTALGHRPDELGGTLLPVYGGVALPRTSPRVRRGGRCCVPAAHRSRGNRDV